MNLRTIAASAVAAACWTAVSHALPSYLDPTHHHAWAQNAGWVNGQPFGYTDEGVQVTRLTVSGIAWGQNIGWIQLGDGTPSNGLRYSNTDAADCGVNIVDWRGNLGGFAWSQNAGWINFGWASASDPDRPRYDFSTNEFTGYAWAQNLGWVNLGSGLLKNVSVQPWLDADSDGIPDSAELAENGNLTTWDSTTDNDGDDLADGWEFLHFAALTSSDGTQDSDGDGWSDRVEYNARIANFPVNPTRTDQPGPWPTPPASSTISDSASFAWSQNLGWMNAKHDQPAGAGIYATAYHLRGTAWLQNAGWLTMGDGTPRDGLRYSNTQADDCGVNVDCDLNLSGFAWAQNIGWINFGWASPSDTNRPRISGSQLVGFAWAQNAGWINLGTLGNQFIGNLQDSDSDGLPDHWEYQRVIWIALLDHTADTDNDGLADAWEFTHFRALEVTDGSGDFDQDGSLDHEEYVALSNPRSQFSLPPPTGSTIAAGNDAFAWGQNTGWVNFRHDRPQAPSGVSVREYVLLGRAWAANFGWISFGDGTPRNGIRYSNTVIFDTNPVDNDYGVNHDGAGNLSGFAWSQNTGWLNFGWAAPGHPDRPRVLLSSGEFAGYAWGQNTGWLNLGAGLKTTSILLVDADNDGMDDAWERERFGNLTAATGTSDADGDGQSDHAEYLGGTDPLDTASALRIIAHSIDGSRTLKTLTFTSSDTRQYRVIKSPDLTTWTPSQFGWFTGFPGSTSATDFLGGPQPKYFFRIEARRPLSP